MTSDEKDPKDTPDAGQEFSVADRQAEQELKDYYYDHETLADELG